MIDSQGLKAPNLIENDFTLLKKKAIYYLFISIFIVEFELYLYLGYYLILSNVGKLLVKTLSCG